MQLTSRSGTKLRVCLVTGLSSSVRLSEYGYHLARALRDRQDIELIILADRSADRFSTSDFVVDRCWEMNSCLTTMRLAWKALQYRPDLIWFNMGFSSLADKPVPAMLAIQAPALMRLLGFYTTVTLHTLMEAVDLDHAGVKQKKLYRVGGSMATRSILHASEVCVLLSSYREVLIQKYRADPARIHAHPHGIFPAAHRPSKHEGLRVLAFGRWGTYKRLEYLLESFESVLCRVPNAKLVLAGSSHPNTPGYFESIAASWSARPWLEYRGYVPEDQIGDLFGRAAAVVLPYNSAAGSSGVAHQAAQFGVPIIATDLPDLREMADSEGLVVEWAPQYDSERFAGVMANLLLDQPRREAIASRNFASVQSQTIDGIVDSYLQRFRKFATPSIHPGIIPQN